MRFIRSPIATCLIVLGTLAAGCGSSSEHGSTATSPLSTSTAGARIWLTDAVMTRLRQRAASADPAWTALKARCDAASGGTIEAPQGNAYPEAPNIGQGYQGDGYLPEVLALGLCYRTASGVDDASAARWAQAGAHLLAAMATPVSGGGQPPSTDDGYGIRNYGVGMALGYDWLRPLLDDATRGRVATALDAWIGWYDKSGFSRNDPVGNYFASYLFAKGAAAIALEGDDPNAAAWWSDLTLRMWPTIAQPAYSGWLAGGGWPEGWQYGPRAVESIVGFLWAASTGKGQAWWDQAPLDCSEAQYIAHFAWPSRKHMDDRGTVHAQSALAPSASTVAMMAAVLEQQGNALAPMARGIASDIQAATGESVDAWQKFLFWDGGAPSTPASSLPTSYFAPGPGHVAMRSSWATDATWASFVSGAYIDAPDSGEQYFDEGGLAIARGDAPVLVNATGWLPQAAGDAGEQFVYDDTWGNRTRLLDNTFYVAGATQDGIAPPQSATHVERFEDAGLYVRARGAQIEQMYAPSGVVNQFVRDVAYVRPSAFVVYDRTTVASSADQWIAWHVPGSPARSASTDGTPRFDVATGGTVNALLPRGASAVTTDLLGAATRIELHSAAAAQDWLTVITVGPPVAVERLSVDDGNVTSGALLGAHLSGTPRETVVLFAADHAAVAPCTGADYAVAQAGDADHLLFDVAPGGYTVTSTPSGGKLAVHVAPGGSLYATPQGTLAFVVSASGAVAVSSPAPTVGGP